MRGLEKVDQIFVLNMAAYNLVRMRTLGQMCLQNGNRGKRAGIAKNLALVGVN